eukprot:917278-Amphidinium_carterae.1
MCVVEFATFWRACFAEVSFQAGFQRESGGESYQPHGCVLSPHGMVCLLLCFWGNVCEAYLFVD